VILDLIVVGVAFAGVIFVVRWWITRLENRQPSGDSDSGFSMWSQDVYDGPRTSGHAALINTGSEMAAVLDSSDWEREGARNTIEHANASDMGSLDSRIETDSFSSDTSNSSDSSSSDSDFSDSSDMGGLDN
jgi:hypothetical protein